MPNHGCFDRASRGWRSETGNAIGLRHDERATIIAMLRRSSQALTTPQIVARMDLGRSAVTRLLADLEAAEVIGRIAGKPQCWYWLADLNEAKAS